MATWQRDLQQVRQFQPLTTRYDREAISQYQQYCQSSTVNHQRGNDGDSESDTILHSLGEVAKLPDIPRLEGVWSLLDSFNDRWALVTGASSGIGAEFAARLAGRGMHLILAARRAEQMNALAQDLLTKHGTNCHIVTIDLATPEAGKMLMDEVDRLGVDVELLVNNAGVGLIGEIESATPDEVQRMLNLNILTLTDLTYRVLPGMLQRGHGAIINVSSVAAFQPVAFMGAYSATKSFVLHFSESLWAESRSRGVTVMALCPGVTTTEFFERAGAPGWLDKHSSQTTFKVVKTALAALEKRRQYIIPGWKNYLLSLLVRFTTRRTAVNESKRYFRTGKKNNQTTKKDAD